MIRQGSPSLPDASTRDLKHRGTFWYTDDEGRAVFARLRFTKRDTGESTYRWWHGAGEGWVQPLTQGWGVHHGMVINYDQPNKAVAGSPHKCPDCRQCREAGIPMPGLDLVPFMLLGLPDLLLNLPAVDVVTYPEGESDAARLAEATSEVVVTDPYGVARPPAEVARWFKGWPGVVMIIMDNPKPGAEPGDDDHNYSGHSKALHKLELLRSVGVDAYVVRPPKDYKDIREYLDDDPDIPWNDDGTVSLLDLDLVVVPEHELRDRARDFRASGQEYRDNEPLGSDWLENRVGDEDEDTDDEEDEDLTGKLLDWEAIKRQRPKEYAIKGWLDLESVNRMSGEPGSMKSFLALDMGIHIALGKRWCGHRVPKQGGPVVFVAAEGARGQANRVTAIERKMKIDSVPGFFLYPEPFQLIKYSKDERQFVANRKLSGFIKMLNKVGARCVIFDTQAQVTVGANESSSQDMGVMTNAARQIAKETGACVILIHHTGWENGNRGRGSSSVFGAVDGEFIIQKDKKSGLVILTSNKVKDHAEPEGLYFAPRVVHLGTDADGDDITSLYLEHEPEGAAEVKAANFSPTKQDKSAAKLEDQQQIAGKIMTLLADNRDGMSGRALYNEIKKNEELNHSFKLFQEALNGLREAGTVTATGEGSKRLYILARKTPDEK